jgi:serine/threonine-protein kinase
MKKPKIVVPDWVLGGAVTVLLLLATLTAWWPIETMEMKVYDLRARMRATGQVGPEIVIAAIDEPSIDTIGRWPWPRSVMADALDIISEAGAKVIGLTVLYTEPEENPGLKVLKQVKDQLTPLAQGKSGAELAPIIETITNAEGQLDTDEKLAGSIGLSGNVVLPLYFDIGTPEGNPTEQLTPSVVKNFITQIDNPNDKGAAAVREAVAIKVPIEKFAKEAKAIGHINVYPDRDGIYRSHMLLVDYAGQYFPSFATQLAATALNLKPSDVSVHLGGGMRLKGINVPTDPSFQMLVDYNGGLGTFKYFSMADIVNKKVQPGAFKDKIVIVGITHLGLAEQISTPVAARALPQPEVIANVVENILHQHFISRPTWAGKVELAMVLLFGAFISFGLPRLGAGKSAAIAAVLGLVFIGFGFWMFLAKGFWIKILYPTLTLAVGYAAVISKKYLFTEQEKQVLEVESVETNRMLALSFQGQGMLDLAFEKLRKCPVDEVKDALYNLGLDFERKRQFNKAVSVYEHIQTKDKKFKDIADRIPRLTAAGETIISGTAGLRKGGADATVLVDGANLKPTLGRYEIERELGRGAMGVVFLGKDPKINRMVAIKTLKFEDDIDLEDQKALKERFFREAESAGRLSHPNIVTIYDTGEDQDMCYIAMELLDGRDLKDWTPKDKLRPMRDVLEMIAKVAEALDYAQEQGIVHRDIKPANIMLLKNGIIKVTDFGIARITTSSRTATGTVMGTPSYMSPEQLAGKKVDGRSDLFSLGATLYEMLTGEKPFTGETVATLLYKIANEPHESVRIHKAELPEAVEKVVDKALAKNPDERYQRGKEMAADLRAAIATLPAPGSSAPAPPPSRAAAVKAEEKTVAMKAEEKTVAMKAEEKTIAMKAD